MKRLAVRRPQRDTLIRSLAQRIAALCLEAPSNSSIEAALEEALRCACLYEGRTVESVQLEVAAMVIAELAEAGGVRVKTVKTWTAAQMKAEGACYTRHKIKRLWAGRERVSLLEILDLSIPVEDRIWVCCLEHPARAVWLDQVVTRCVRAHALACGVPSIESWAQQWLSGEDRSETAAQAASLAAWEALAQVARAATWAAAQATWASREAARAARAARAASRASRAAAREASREAARATWEAVRAAARAASRAPWEPSRAEAVEAKATKAKAQELEQQLADMRALLVAASVAEGKAGRGLENRDEG